VSFVTGNAAPVAADVKIVGNTLVGTELEVTYVYNDAEGDVETGSTIQWLVALNSLGAEEEPIEGATNATFKLTSEFEFKYIRVAVTPKAVTGTPAGAQVKSDFIGPVGATGSETITFTYNGGEVTYGVITSSVTGRKWMDRNLGALQVAESSSDYKAYGDFFQYGRPADGHQLIVWTKSNSNWFDQGGVPVNGTTDVKSSTPIPGHSNFITSSNEPWGDWLSPQVQNLWSTPDYVNNPCPSGWHIPTLAEWEAEHLESDSAPPKAFDAIGESKTGNALNGFNQLRLTTGGQRRPDDNPAIGGPARIQDGGDASAKGRGSYWTSTADTAPGSSRIAQRMFWLQYDDESSYTSSLYNWLDSRAYGLSCRCIKNQ
jgi:uncharacterized protein (TIGR02145 family)